jgi:S-methylmethionine-dependent homocysteine/selenocysteine methylase
MTETHKRPLLLDGGMGRELRFRGVEILTTIWSANALVTAPEVVRDVHLDFINAGAEIITTNTYGVIRHELAREGIESRFEELNVLACELAHDARLASGREVRIAGSLPPLNGSYRPDRVWGFDVLAPLYREQVDAMSRYVDLFICETMSSGAEGYAAAYAACRSGKEVWVSWTLHEDRSGRLRSGETIAEARAALRELPVSGFLVNCCAPESITSAMRGLAALDCEIIGGYANTFTPVPDDWTLDGSEPTSGLIELRDDLQPDAYAEHAAAWLDGGATVVGGCCGTRPAHIKRLRELIDTRYEAGSSTR